MPTTTAILFDFDLTLADATEGVFECANYALHALDLPVADMPSVKASIGLPLAETFQLLSGNAAPALAQAFSKHFVARADEVMVSYIQIYPQVPQLLRELNKLGIQTGIVSNRFRHRIEAVLEREGLTAMVQVIVGAEDVTRHKPHPEGLQRALQQLNTDPVNAIFVGDHPIDAEAAQQAGMRFVAVLTGTASLESWQSLAVTDVLADVGGLLRHI